MLFTQVYRIIIRKPVAPGGPDSNQEPACTLLCKYTVKAWQRACNCKYTQLEKSTTGGGPQQWRQLPATQRWWGHRRTEASTSCLQMETSPSSLLIFFVSVIFSPWNFVPLKVVQSGRLENEAPKWAPERWSWPPPAGDQQDRLSSYYLRTGDEVGGRFLLIKRQGEWDHRCTPSMHAQHWAATE